MAEWYAANRTGQIGPEVGIVHLTPLFVRNRDSAREMMRVVAKIFEVIDIYFASTTWCPCHFEVSKVLKALKISVDPLHVCPDGRTSISQEHEKPKVDYLSLESATTFGGCLDDELYPAAYETCPTSASVTNYVCKAECVKKGPIQDSGWTSKVCGPLNILFRIIHLQPPIPVYNILTLQ